MLEHLNSGDYIILSEETTNLDYGFFPEKRPINIYLDYGFIPLDKPRGPSSHEVVAWVRRMLQIEKAGHSGTLDPQVSGVLPIALGQATKALGLFLLGPKEYITVIRLHSDLQEQKILDVFQEFTGTIYQRPPQRSSVKRVTRTKKIYQINLIEKFGRLLVVKVNCEAGTYIRKLVYDIGEALGVGATMVELRRTKVFNLDEEKGLVKLHDLSAAVYKWKKENNEELVRKLVQPIENALTPFKKVFIKDSAVDAICHGAQVAIPGIAKLSSNIVKEDLVTVLTLKGELVALGKALLSAEEIEELTKGFAVKVERVIMQKGTYPKMWK